MRFHAVAVESLAPSIFRGGGASEKRAQASSAFRWNAISDQLLQLLLSPIQGSNRLDRFGCSERFDERGVEQQILAVHPLKHLEDLDLGLLREGVRDEPGGFEYLEPKVIAPGIPGGHQE